MSMTPAVLVARLRTPEGRKLWRYSLVSAMSVGISFVVIVFCSGVLSLSAVVSNTVATAVATIPNYALNRRWAWGKTGRSHIGKEIIPFWVLAFLGYGFSTVSVDYVEHFAKHEHYAHLVRTGLVGVTSVAAYGILWIAKFVIFNRLLFVHRQAAQPSPQV